MGQLSRPGVWPRAIMPSRVPRSSSGKITGFFLLLGMQTPPVDRGRATTWKSERGRDTREGTLLQTNYVSALGAEERIEIRHKLPGEGQPM